MPILVLAGLIIAAGSANATAYVFPTDAGVVNAVTSCSVPNNGVTDATSALQTCITNALNTRNTVVYLPAGTYKISNTIRWLDGGGNWAAYLRLQGHDPSDTTIVLANSSSGYGSFGTPKAMLFTASSGVGNPGSNALGQGDAAFNQYISNLTVNTGTGNPGAVAIDFLGTNNARIDNCIIVDGDGTSNTGIDTSRNFSGPELISNTTVTGFGTGIAINGGNVSTTLNHVTLSGQRSVGISCGAKNCFMADVTSSNSVPAVISGEFTLTLVINSHFTGGSGARSAIEVSGAGPPQLFTRNTSSSGYASLVKYLGSTVAGSSPSEYTSTAAYTLFTSGSTSLNLTIQNFPSYNDSNLSNWVNVQSFGALPNGSDAATAIQAAFDACTGSKTTVYFPQGTYNIGTHLLIRPGSTCKHIVGFGSAIQPVSGAAPSDGTAIIYQATSGTLVLENLDFVNNTAQFATGVSHTGTGTIAIQESHMDGQYVASTGAGDVYLDDMSFGAFIFASGQHAWSVQLDAEGDSSHVQNHGSTLWILGLTTEDHGPIVTSDSGSVTEVLGIGVLLIGNDTSNYVLQSTDSSVSFTFGTSSDFYYTHLIKEIRSGVTHTLDCPAGVCTSVPGRVGTGANVALYTGYTSSPPIVTTTAASSITATTASSGGNVTNGGGSTVTARGVCRSLSVNPTTSDTCTSNGTGTGVFSSSLTGMVQATTYHIRAFATNSSGTSYGSDLTFQTTIITDPGITKRSSSGKKNRSGKKPQ